MRSKMATTGRLIQKRLLSLLPTASCARSPSPASRLSSWILPVTATSRHLNGRLMGSGWLIPSLTPVAPTTFTSSPLPAKTSRRTRSPLIPMTSAARALLPMAANFSSSVLIRPAAVAAAGLEMLRCKSIQSGSSVSTAIRTIRKTGRKLNQHRRQPATEATRRRISFNVRVKIDRPAEWAEIFGDAWRTMKYRFYDPAMHGMDWDAAKAKYGPLVSDVGDRQELLNIINEMIGELNASHTGAAPPPAGRAAGGVSTGNLGIELEPDAAAGRYRVTYVYEDGPADKDWVKVSNGDYLIAIGGKQVKAGDNYWELMNSRLNRKVEVTFNNKPAEEGAWKARIEPVNQQAYSQLRYERWVKTRRDLVDKLSAGRVGYLHIQAMNPPSLKRFEKELRENHNKEAVIIDERWNGGGNIEQELLAILVQREYQVWQPRGTEATGRPFAGFFGPKVVLQNWRSASNAEMFPAGFRALGLGKVIGTPTMGAVIGTGSYSLIDGSTVRTPGVGVYLADAKHTNMENYGVQPDVLVDNSPEDNLAGRDRQLETAVEELLKQLGGPKRNIASRD